MFRKLVRNKKAIDTIMATLLMVVIVVAASVMVFVYATGLFGALMRAPTFQKQALGLEVSSFGPVNANSNVSLFLRNTGSVPITLVSYFVKDASGNQYAQSPWPNQPSIAPTAGGWSQVLISSICGCSYTGAPFTFQIGQSYTITLTSSLGTQFSFSVVRYS